MTLTDINNILGKLAQHPDRDTVIELSFALVEWFGLTPANDKKPRLLSPKTQRLMEYLYPAPFTVQPQLYRITADNQHMLIRFAVLKKLKKDYISQLVDNDPGLGSYQAFSKDLNLANTTYVPSQPYFVHFVTTPDYDRLILIFSQGDQKRILAFRNKLTHTQYNKIVQQWQGIATKPKAEIAELLWRSIDIKEVNKEFYRLIKEQFDSLLGIARSQFPKAAEKDVKQFAVRLIGRYIFCWFLKEKGIIPSNLLSSANIENNKNDFFQTYLYHLFFNTLNEEVQNRSVLLPSEQLNGLFNNIPYLNGGLFEKHEDDVLFEHLDLNHWLIAFVKVLESFAFTVDESSSQYQQVAIDPEMLGRIFENLLASQNEETSELANQRKAFGAFYTPREIVDYMVNESLKVHLETHLLPQEVQEDSNMVQEPLVAYTGSLFQHVEPKQTRMALSASNKAEADAKRERLKAKIDKFLQPDCSQNPFDKGETLNVREALENVTVLDPACGSGAFPMGMMLRLMELRQLIGHGHKNNYELKCEILSHNIFGVDIMPMAVEIARLRAWLSLVLEADYKPTDRKNNFGIAALPNLDFKFVCANTLIDSGYDAFLQLEKKPDSLMQMDSEIQKLAQLRNEYFDPKGDKNKKAHLQTEFYETKRYIKAKSQSSRKTWNLDDFFNKVDDWDPFNDSKPSSFFSPAWMFGVTGGFSIVIGNPPYVQMQKQGGRFADMLKEGKYKTFERTGDVYAIFYEVGIKFLKRNGVLTFITSNKWMRAAYGETLRNFFINETNPLSLIDFGGYQVFDATVDTNILIAQKALFRNSIQTCVLNKDFSLSNMRD